MPNPRPLSVVKLVLPISDDAKIFDLKEEDRFLYLGEIAQDPTRCMVEGLFCGKRIPYLPPSAFEEVASNDF